MPQCDGYAVGCVTQSHARHSLVNVAVGLSQLGPDASLVADCPLSTALGQAAGGALRSFNVTLTSEVFLINSRRAKEALLGGHTFGGTYQLPFCQHTRTLSPTTLAMDHLHLSYVAHLIIVYFITPCTPHTLTA